MPTPTRYKDLLDYTVSYRAVWTILGLAVISLVAGWFIYDKMKPPGEDEKARQELKAASRLLARAEACVEPATPAPQKDRLERASAAVQGAQQDVELGRYADAMAAARDAAQILEDFIDQNCTTRDAEAEFVSLSGDVEVKKAHSFRYVGARPDSTLVQGDRIKTGAGKATILYLRSGETQEIRPNSIIEIKSVTPLPDGKARVESVLEVGEVQLKSVEGTDSTIVARRGSIVPRGGDVVEVESPEGATEDRFRSLKGGARVTHVSGAQRVLPALSRVSATDEALSEPAPDLPGPELAEPIEGRVFTFEKPEDGVVRWEWRNLPGASRYVLQVGRNELFIPVLNDGDESVSDGTSARTTGLPPNQYWWRVAGVDGKGVRGRWSEQRTFTVRGGAGAAPVSRPPPKLEILEKVPIGDKVIVSGKTDAYVTLEVLVNGRKYQPVDVGDDGGFQHIVPLEREGKNVITFVARDAYGAETRTDIEVVSSFY
jgi:hypothetical protein